MNESGLTFPNFNAPPNELLQTNLIFPVPCEFISPDLPSTVSIADRLFVGQSPEFTELLLELAQMRTQRDAGGLAPEAISLGLFASG
jgi:hypothetical protein